MAPSGWRVREALSYDLPVLWPAEYEALVRKFERATAGERDLFLKRSGVRWCVPIHDRPSGYARAGQAGGTVPATTRDGRCDQCGETHTHWEEP